MQYLVRLTDRALRDLEAIYESVHGWWDSLRAIRRF